MKIWIVTIYEPMPFADRRTKPQRCGMLAGALAKRGHTVEIWTSAFDHVSHKHIHGQSILEKIDNGVSIQFIKGCGYPGDISPKRFLHNRQTAREFRRLASNRGELPDIIFAPIPILELAQAAVEYAIERNIPVVVDVRDLWPDIYLSMIPQGLHVFGKMLLFSEFNRAKYIFKNATGITAVSAAYLQKGLSYVERRPTCADKCFPLGSESLVSKRPEKAGKTFDSIVSRLDIGKDKFVVTYVGTFSKFYDIQNILTAAKMLSANENIQIVVIGSGEQSEKYFRKAISLPNVVMTGWLNATEVSSILEISDLGLVAYSKDAPMSLPNKPFEYMAVGLPLLSSLPGELEEMIQMNNIGRNYIAENPVSLSKEIQWFYNHPEESKKMGERSKVLFLKEFQSGIVYENLSKHLETIVSSYDRERQ